MNVTEHTLPFIEVLRDLSKSKYEGVVLFSNVDSECLFELSESKISKASFTDKIVIFDLVNNLNLKNIIPLNLSELIKKKIPNVKILKEFLIRESFLNLDKFNYYLNDTIKLVFKNLILSKEIKYKLANSPEELRFKGISIQRSQSIVHLMLDMLSQLKIEIPEVCSDIVNTTEETIEMSIVKVQTFKQKRTFYLKEEHREILMYLVLAIIFLISYKLVYYFFISSNGS